MSLQETWLDRILAPGQIQVRFQPIVRRVGHEFRLSSVEALVRGPSGSNLERADILFDYVRRKREESRVDRSCIAAIFAEARHLPFALALSINVHAATLARDPGLVQALLDRCAEHAVDPSHLTIEIVEHVPAWAGPELFRALAGLRAHGVRIALDDVGLVSSNFKLIVDCRPDCLKIDGYFVRGVRADRHRQAILHSLVVLARDLGAELVAEGLEQRADIDLMSELGITLFQGFLFSEPVAASEIAGFADRLGETPEVAEAADIARAGAVAEARPWALTPSSPYPPANRVGGNTTAWHDRCNDTDEPRPPLPSQESRKEWA